MRLSVETKPIIIKCELLHDLPENACDDVIANGRFREVAKGETFFQQGEDALALYIILEGQVKLTQLTQSGDQVIVSYLGSGDGVGIIVSLSHMAYPLTAEAVTHCTAVSWHRDTMLQLAQTYPQIALNGMTLIARRFVKLQQSFQELSTLRVEQRVARALTRLVRQFGKRIEIGVLIDMPLSRQDLAEMTGTNLYNVSRILSKWERVGWVSSSRRQIVLTKPHELVALAEDLYG